MSESPLAVAATKYGLRFVLVRAGQKTPHVVDKKHAYTSDLAEVRAHLATGGNIGLVGHNIAVLDWDDEVRRPMMFDLLGPLPLTVQTASGKHHTYIAADDTLPGKIWYGETSIGDIRRLPTEYVVCPPSRLDSHPNSAYRLLVPEVILEPLPQVWREYLECSQPSHDKKGQPFEIPEAIGKGDRHRTIFRFTRSWKAQGFTLPETLYIIGAANENIIKPSLPERELVQFVTRAYNAPDRAQWKRK